MNIWLVGASTGIGEAVARQFAESGACVFVSARNQKKLFDLSERYGDCMIPVSLDVCDDWSVNSAMNDIARYTSTLDKVIVNAGTCEYIDSEEINIETVRSVFETNFFGALNVVNYALPLLRRSALQNSKGNSPQLVFVSSSVTYQALPRAGAYGASKAALRYFAESLKIDLQLEDIDVRVVSPGFVETPLTDKNDFPMPFKLSADEAAKRIVQGLESSSFDISFPKRFTTYLKLIHALPSALRFKLLAKLSRHKEDLPHIRQSL